MGQGKVRSVMPVYSTRIHGVGMPDVDDEITTNTNKNGKQNTFQEPKLPTKSNETCRGSY